VEVLPVPPSDATPEAPPEEDKGTKSEYSLRRFIEGTVLFVCTVILLRSIAVEPFGVPTGSMAMTLAGNHKSCVCPRCGYPVMIGSNGAPPGEGPGPNPAYTTGWCANCGLGELSVDDIPETAGDRLLVDKNIFELRRPRRWEPVVFRCPSDLTKPYVKRVVALPGERVQIRDGDVYINGQLARKVLSECRAVKVLHFDNNFQPRKTGWKARWRVGQPGVKADAKSLSEADEYLDGALLAWPAPASPRAGYRWLVYRNWLLDENREEPIRDQFAYNGTGHRHELKFVHDFFVDMEVEAGGGIGEFAVGLTDGKDDVTATFPVGAADGPGQPQAIRVTDASGALLGVSTPWMFAPGRAHRIEFSFFDRRISLAVDGAEVVPAIDLPPALQRQPVSRPAWLGFKGVPGMVRNFRIFRDIHYASTGRNGIGEPWPLGPDEYFMLGDNSSNSEDSRYWSIPGVPEKNLLGRPLLLHQPSRWTTIANRWELQSIDWRRVRWIR
jgi:signal peptidase I